MSDEFEPCVIEYPEARTTEMVIRDCFTVWERWDSKDGEVDLGYDANGALVAVRIWAHVQNRRQG